MPATLTWLDHDAEARNRPRRILVKALINELVQEARWVLATASMEDVEADSAVAEAAALLGRILEQDLVPVPDPDGPDVRETTTPGRGCWTPGAAAVGAVASMSRWAPRPAYDGVHIRWRKYRGPDVEGNGIALCALHHRRFDRGAFTLVPGTDHETGALPRGTVSDKACGGRGIRFALLDFHELVLQGPPEQGHGPAEEHLAWHRKEAFQGPEWPWDG